MTAADYHCEDWKQLWQALYGLEYRQRRIERGIEQLLELRNLKIDGKNTFTDKSTAKKGHTGTKTTGS